MAAFVVFSDAPNTRRSDGIGAVLVTAADAAAARTAATALVGTGAGSVSEWAAVQVSAGDLAVADVAFQGLAVGAADPWPRLTRGGNFLAA